MSNPNKSKEIEILPNAEYWQEMKIKPAEVVERFSLESYESHMQRFTSDDLKRFFELNAGGSAKALSKDDLVSLMLRGQPILVNTLLVIAQYSAFVSKRVLQELCRTRGEDPGNRTATQLALLLFNTTSDLLRRGRIASIGYRIRNNYFFGTQPSKVKTDVTKEPVIQKIANDVENQLSTKEQRARLIEHYFDDARETYRFFVKYEDREQRIEEWDGSYWYRPVDWIVIDYDPTKQNLSVRCRNEKRATKFVSIISKRATSKKDSFVQKKLEEWIETDSMPDLKDIEKDGFKVLARDIRMLRIEDANLTNRPALVLRGSNLDETLADLKKRHKLHVLDGAEIVAFSIKVSFAYEGVEDEVTVELRKGRSDYSFTKDTNERVKRHLIDSLPRLIAGE